MFRVVVAALAISLFPALSDASPRPSAEDRKQAKAHSAQGTAFFNAGAYDDAIKEYQAAYALTPVPGLLFTVAQSYRLKGDKREAISWYEKYLAADPEGRGSEDAREYLATLKLKLEVEEAEAARKRSAEEAAAAQKRADESEAARKRALEEQSAHQRSAADDEARMRKLAAELEETNRTQRAAEAERQRQRLEAANRVGFAYRVSGGVAVALGVIAAAGLVWIPVYYGTNAKNRIKSISDNPSNLGTWSTTNDGDLKAETTDSRAMIAMWAAGGALIVVGATLAIVGTRLRSNAVERARGISVTLAPSLAPSRAGLVLEGRF